MRSCSRDQYDNGSKFMDSWNCREEIASFIRNESLRTPRDRASGK